MLEKWTDKQIFKTPSGLTDFKNKLQLQTCNKWKISNVIKSHFSFFSVLAKSNMVSLSKLNICDLASI